MTNPSLLAAGVTVEGTFDPFELYAGDVDVVTISGVVGAVAIAQFAVLARAANGTLITYGAPVAASMTGLFSAVATANDTVTIAGVVFTGKAAPAGDFEFAIGATATESAQHLATEINAHSNMLGVTALWTALGALTLTAAVAGTAGNSIAVSEASGTFAWTAGAIVLSGGAGFAGEKPVGIAAQGGAPGVSIPFYVAGGFNANVIVFPASFTTLLQKQALFDLSPIVIAVPKGVSTRITYS